MLKAPASRRLWIWYLIAQAVGLVCLRGGEAFAITPAGYFSRMIALVVLEPGLLLMEMVIGRLLWGTHFTVEEIFQIGVAVGVLFNIATLFAVLKTWRALHNRREMRR